MYLLRARVIAAPTRVTMAETKRCLRMSSNVFFVLPTWQQIYLITQTNHPALSHTKMVAISLTTVTNSVCIWIIVIVMSVTVNLFGEECSYQLAWSLGWVIWVSWNRSYRYPVALDSVATQNQDNLPDMYTAVFSEWCHSRRIWGAMYLPACLVTCLGHMSELEQELSESGGSWLRSNTE